ncbi:MAG: VIT1/CCC1 transporter family protein [Planctomycetes bacterium]|nr:VIT1/CCC1 transporter family protein [Planctomycetota bacterium]
MSEDPRTIERWLSYLKDEADAAFLYRTLAGVEKDEARRGIYLELASVEDRHAKLWTEVLERHGRAVSAGGASPSTRARLMGWIARRFGAKHLLPRLLAEEGREVKKYIGLSKSEPAEDVRDAALVLARESGEHAGRLAQLGGGAGEPWHRTGSGGFLRNVVYGFNDGLTANFGLVAGVIGADVSAHVVLVSGVAGMIADALSMGSSGYLAAKSEREVWAHEIGLEEEELRLMPELEREELALLYEAKGIARERAQGMAREVMENPRLALDEKVREELGIGGSHASPLREGWVTGTATALGAFLPVLPFLFSTGATAIWTSFALAMSSHFLVGAARSLFTGRAFLRSGIDMFLVGLGVAAVGYVVGDFVARNL